MVKLWRYALFLPLVVWAIVACSQGDPATDYSAERAEYLEIANASVDVSGADPVQMASEIFGSQGTVTEGNFVEEIVVSKQDENTTVILVTQTGLADDSIEGIRYRLEFIPKGNEWLLNWAGQQMRCRRGEGAQEWTTEICP
ncbi:MAG: hypothetical protein HC921_17415 [Synechococcaceae cyanobacterium SM2_3_1]|nr:hypothetical protein [Synechococcaceae cyanobacterium SM2_3_1]